MQAVQSNTPELPETCADAQTPGSSVVNVSLGQYPLDIVESAGPVDPNFRDESFGYDLSVREWHGYAGFFPPDFGTPAYITYLKFQPVNVALDAIEHYDTPEAKAQGLLQDIRFIKSARGKKLMKELASNASEAQARLLEIQQNWEAEQAARKARRRSAAAAKAK